MLAELVTTLLIAVKLVITDGVDQTTLQDVSTEMGIFATLMYRRVALFRCSEVARYPESC